MIFTRKDCREMQEGETYEGKLVILREDYFKEEYRNAENQLFLAQGGFGCDPTKIGRAVFGKFYDGEICRVNREDILGIASEEAIAEWERAYQKSRSCFERKEN